MCWVDMDKEVSREESWRWAQGEEVRREEGFRVCEYVAFSRALGMGSGLLGRGVEDEGGSLGSCEK